MTRITLFRLERNTHPRYHGPIRYVKKFSVWLPSDFTEEKIKNVVKKRITEGRAETGRWRWVEGGFKNWGIFDIGWGW